MVHRVRQCVHLKYISKSLHKAPLCNTVCRHRAQSEHSLPVTATRQATQPDTDQATQSHKPMHKRLSPVKKV